MGNEKIVFFTKLFLFTTTIRRLVLQKNVIRMLYSTPKIFKCCLLQSFKLPSSLQFSYHFTHSWQKKQLQFFNFQSSQLVIIFSVVYKLSTLRQQNNFSPLLSFLFESAWNYFSCVSNVVYHKFITLTSSLQLSSLFTYSWWGNIFHP